MAEHLQSYLVNDPLILQSEIFKPYGDRIRAGLSLRLLGNMSFQREPESNVVDRRQEFFRRMGISLKDAVGMQLVHGNRVVRVGAQDRGRGAFSADDAIPVADALITNEPIVWLFSTHADCAPIFFYDPKKSVAGIAHVGWRGLLAGLLGKIVEQCSLDFGTDPSDWVVWVGPAIGPCCFEVGQEIADAFMTAYTGEETVMVSKGKPHVNLWRAIMADLKREGIPEKSTEITTECTSCISRYGSYRRDRDKAVSMGAVIGLIPQGV
jgi:YfiH family protein